MYIPKHFKLEDEAIINEIIDNYSFATLVSQHNGEPYATHLPLVWKPDESALYGHFAKKNGQWHDIENERVLAIFQGPHCYISSTWYETKRTVSTWNYVSVHLYGTLEILTDDKKIYESLEELIIKYEGAGSSNELSSLDPNFVEGMVKGIVPFKIKVEEIQAKAKLSQNHPLERQKRVIKELEKSKDENERLIAAMMKRNLKSD